MNGHCGNMSMLRRRKDLVRPLPVCLCKAAVEIECMAPHCHPAHHITCILHQIPHFLLKLIVSCCSSTSTDSAFAMPLQLTSLLDTYRSVGVMPRFECHLLACQNSGPVTSILGHIRAYFVSSDVIKASNADDT